MNGIRIYTKNLADITNNYSLDLIEDAVWEDKITKRSLIAMLEEIPKSPVPLFDAIMMSGIVTIMVVFFQLGHEVLLNIYALNVVIQALVSFFVSITVITGIRHIWKYQTIKKRIYSLQTKPIHLRKKSVYKKFIYLISVFMGTCITWLWLSAQITWIMTTLLLLGIGYILFLATNAKYRLHYINKNTGYLVHHIQYDKFNLPSKEVSHF